MDPRLDAFALRLIHGLVLWVPGLALGHVKEALPSSGFYEPWLVVALGLAAGLYAAGVLSLWRKAGPGRGVSAWNAASFASGWLVVVAALLSPLDPLGARYFSAHMVQHELLMALAAPLLVLGRPVQAWTWGLPRATRRILGHASQHRWISSAWDVLNTALCAWIIHAGALWLWHIPALFDAALTHEGIHVLQHASFLASAVLFWSVMLNGGPQRAPHATCVLGLFTTMAHSGALGALLTFGAEPWYMSYANLGHDTALTALEDQQLGGLIMWVPGTLSYLLAGLWGTARLLAPSRPVVSRLL
jgi:putative membrane protein